MSPAFSLKVKKETSSAEAQMKASTEEMSSERAGNIFKLIAGNWTAARVTY